MRHWPRVLPLVLAFVLLSCSGQRALWVDVKEDNERKTIAVTEAIARKALQGESVRFAGKNKEDLVTNELLLSVLDGRERSRTVRDREGNEAIVYMKRLDPPGKNGGKNDLVLETYKNGRQTFRFALPNLDISLGGERDDISLSGKLEWKSWLPFLAKEGGAVYLRDHSDETEIWLYVD